MNSLIKVAAVCLMLAACADTGPKAPKEGRITIGGQEPVVLKQSGSKLSLASKQQITEWTLANYNATNNVPRVSLPNDLNEAYSVSIGEELDDNQLSIPMPVIADNVIYTLDSRFQLQATDFKTGERLWRKELSEIQGTSFKSIGLALAGKNLYAVSGNGLVMATDLSGNQKWSVELKTQLRSAPVIQGEELYITDINNRLYVLDTQNGKMKWTYQGEKTLTNLFGVGSVAVSGSKVVMPTTNGRVNVFDRSSGVLLWAEDMWQKRTYNPVMDIPQMTASPVIDKNRVYLIGNAGKMGAYQLDNGMSIFTLAIGGRETPMVSGSALVMVDNQNRLMALNTANGQKYWMVDLKGTEEDKKNKPTWYAPIIAGDTIVVASNMGDVVFLNAQDGKEQKRFTVDKIAVRPIVVNDSLIILTQEGEMQVYR